MTNGEVARVLGDIAIMLEMEGANPFRVRAYREAARVVASAAEPVQTLAAEAGRLEGMRGIGKDLAQKIRDVAGTGTTALHAELRAKYPAEVVALTDLQGMGPKRVRLLFDRLAIRSRADLAAAARAGKLRELAGFGETLERNVLKALEATREWEGRLLLSEAWPLANAILERVRACPGVAAAELAGSFRRRRETIGDLDVVACGGTSETVMEAFVTAPAVAEVRGRGDTKSSVRLANGLQVDLRHVPVEAYGAALLYFTGSKEHNIRLRRIAIEKGMSLNEYALTRGDEVVAARTEEDVYRALGLPWIPPELREAHGEIEVALAGRLPRLIELDDLRGDLHLHTDRTDGRESLETMVRAARDRGYEYCAITDHSQALAMARGFDAARVRRSVEEIAEVRRQVPGIEVLHGLEVDILADGALDLEDEALALLDWVVVSIHSRFDQTREQVTERVLRAISHPLVRAMGHPTGRMIGRREAIAMDLERVLDRAAERGVAMEINAQPHRTDLSDAHARLARARGVSLVIDTDAHRLPELDYMRYGVFAARRAGLSREDVLNTLPLAQFRERALRPRGGAAAGGAGASAPPPVAAAAAGAGAGRRGAAKPTAAPRSGSAARAAAEPGRAAKVSAAPRSGSGARAAAGSRRSADGAAGQRRGGKAAGSGRATSGAGGSRGNAAAGRSSAGGKTASRGARPARKPKAAGKRRPR